MNAPERNFTTTVLEFGNISSPIVLQKTLLTPLSIACYMVVPADGAVCTALEIPYIQNVTEKCIRNDRIFRRIITS